jgi:copper(I)-binding protein
VPDDDRLVAASSPLAERIELHGIRVVGADIDMRPLANWRRHPGRQHHDPEAARLPPAC